VTATKEVADLLAPVRQALDDVGSIVTVVRDGTDYLNAHHPAARGELKDLLEELGKLMRVAAHTSSIVTRFRFAVEASAGDQELRAFNDRLLEHQEAYDRLHEQLDQVRVRSSTIGDRRFKLEIQSGTGALAVVDAPRPSADRLEEILRRVWSDDSKVILEFRNLDSAVKRALDDVSSHLGRGSDMLKKNIPIASSVLAEHAETFQPIESSANWVDWELTSTLLGLRGPSNV
jgi:hypothetical protein